MCHDFVSGFIVIIWNSIILFIRIYIMLNRERENKTSQTNLAIVTLKLLVLAGFRNVFLSNCVSSDYRVQGTVAASNERAVF